MSSLQPRTLFKGWITHNMLVCLIDLPALGDLCRVFQVPRRNQKFAMFNVVGERYRAERMPRRAMTKQGYNTWLNGYILPKWGDCSLQELQARPVDLWLQSLPLAPKSKVHIRGLVRALWDFAMWRETCRFSGIPWSWSRLRARPNA